MTNIELYGFGQLSETTKTCIFTLIEKKALSIDINNVVVTTVFSVVDDKQGTLRPYVRVASLNEVDLRVAQLINKHMGLNVQWLHLDGFFEGKH